MIILAAAVAALALAASCSAKKRNLAEQHEKAAKAFTDSLQARLDRNDADALQEVTERAQARFEEIRAKGDTLEIRIFTETFGDFLDRNSEKIAAAHQPSVLDKIKDKAGKVEARTEETAKDLKKDAETALDKAKDNTRKAAEDIKEKAAGAKEKAAEKIDAAKEKVESGVKKADRKLDEAAEKARKKLDL